MPKIGGANIVLKQSIYLKIKSRHVFPNFQNSAMVINAGILVSGFPHSHELLYAFLSKSQLILVFEYINFYIFIS